MAPLGITIFFLILGFSLLSILIFLCWHTRREANRLLGPSISRAERGELPRFTALRARLAVMMAPSVGTQAPIALEAQHRVRKVDLPAVPAYQPKPRFTTKAQTQSKASKPVAPSAPEPTMSYWNTEPAAITTNEPVSPMLDSLDEVPLTPVSPLRPTRPGPSRQVKNAIRTESPEWPQLPSRPQKVKSGVFVRESAAVQHFKANFGKKPGQMF